LARITQAHVLYTLWLAEEKVHCQNDKSGSLNGLFCLFPCPSKLDEFNKRAWMFESVCVYSRMQQRSSVLDLSVTAAVV